MKLSKLIDQERVFNILLKEGFLNLRLSQLGKCHRSFKYNSLKVKEEEPSEKTRKMWKERLEDESNIIKKIKKKYEVKHTGSSQKTYYRRLIGSRFILSSTPDGSVKYNSEWIPLEIKSLNPFRFQMISSPEKLSREYFIQIQGEVILTRAEGALLVIGDSKTKDEIKEIFVPRDESAEQWIEERLKFIFKERKKVIYPEFLPGSPECKYCLYKEKCKKDIYKTPKISYNRFIEIDSDDFDFIRVQESIKRFKTSLLELEDLKINLTREAHKIRDFLIKREASRIKVGRNKIGKEALKGVENEYN